MSRSSSIPRPFPHGHIIPEHVADGVSNGQFLASHDSDPAELSKEDAEALVQRINGFTRGGGKTSVWIGIIAKQTIRWARNRVMVSGDRFNRMITVDRWVNNLNNGSACTNQFDSVSLEHLVRVAEERSKLADRGTRIHGELYQVQPPEFPLLDTPVWSDTTAAVDAETLTRLTATLVEEAEQHNLLSAGYIEAKRSMDVISDSLYGTRYRRFTDVQCSATVRHPSGNGSGWAGGSGYDWRKIDHVALAARALQKCVSSVDPVRIEPGRYTVILEPQAVFDLVWNLVHSFYRRGADEGKGPFALAFDADAWLHTTKLGLRIVDERITIDHDPSEEGSGVLPERGLGPITWIRNGILMELGEGRTISNSRRYALRVLNENNTPMERFSFRMSGGTATIEEMISSTKRGLLVTRFSGVTVLDTQSLLSTGVTRDGLWLIENGAIVKPVKNLRFAESPLFVLNQIDTLGHPQPVFTPFPFSWERFGDDIIEFMIGPISAKVPPIKARDFNFAATVDAI